MPFKCAGLTLLPLLVAACHGASPGSVEPDRLPVPKPRAACYALDYHKDELASRLPSLIALDEGGGSGRAFWFPGPRPDTTWRVFYAGGHWDRQGRGHVVVNFDAEEVHVTLDLEQREGMLSGRALRRAPDAEGKEVERSSAIDGRHVSCPRPPTN